MPVQPGIVYLNSITTSNFTLDQLYDALAEGGHQVNGKPVGIVKYLENLCLSIKTEWESVLKPYFIRNLTATQYLYSRGIEVYPFEADINHIWEDKGTSTPDAPWNKIGSMICCDVSKDGGASLTRTAWGGRKELTPRLRLNVQVLGKIYQLFAHRKEYLITFNCYAHSSKEAYLLKEGLNHWFQTRQEVMYQHGAQKFFVDLSPVPVGFDKRTSMYGRTLKLYLRLEDWYLGQPAPPINEVGIEWINMTPGLLPSIGDSVITEDIDL